MTDQGELPQPPEELTGEIFAYGDNSEIQHHQDEITLNRTGEIRQVLKPNTGETPDNLSIEQKKYVEQTRTELAQTATSAEETEIKQRVLDSIEIPGTILDELQVGSSIEERLTILKGESGHFADFSRPNSSNLAAMASLEDAREILKIGIGDYVPAIARLIVENGRLEKDEKSGQESFVWVATVGEENDLRNIRAEYYPNSGLPTKPPVISIQAKTVREVNPANWKETKERDIYDVSIPLNYGEGVKYPSQFYFRKFSQRGPFSMRQEIVPFKQVKKRSGPLGVLSYLRAQQYVSAMSKATNDVARSFTESSNFSIPKAPVAQTV
jgi:hypothetical protein